MYIKYVSSHEVAGCSVLLLKQKRNISYKLSQIQLIDLRSFNLKYTMNNKHLVILDILNRGPVSEKPDEGLFFVDKETEEMRTTGMIHYYLYPKNVQYCSKVSYHLSSRFSRDGSCFSRESLKGLVWHISCMRNQIRVTILALHFISKVMGPANIHCKIIHVCIDHSLKFISIKHRTLGGNLLLSSTV